MRYTTMGPMNGVLWLLGILSMICSDLSFAQTKRSSRLTSSRTFGLNVKSSSSSGIEFDCPEEFGYYPHPSDCTQYYVCVFGGALLESCTGGLMYSHELQTCDWPRNVGCEITEIGSLSSSQSQSTSRDISPRVPQTKQQVQQHVPSRVRFSSLSTGVGQQLASKQSSQQLHQQQQQPQQHHRQQHQQQHHQQQQISPVQIQTIPPPPELRIAPNPIITSRGQPKPILDAHEDIAKLYAEAHETLPPAEEEESDRQQRVYRGQPSTVGQVQRDRDGIIHQANVNALPNHGKVGSYAYGSQSNQFSDEIYLQDIDDNKINETEYYNNDDYHLNRKRRDTKLIDLKNFTETDNIDDINTEDPIEKNSTIPYGKRIPNDKENQTSIEFYRSTRQLRPAFSGPGFWQLSNGHLHQVQRVGPKSFQSSGGGSGGSNVNFETFSPYLSPPAFASTQFSKTNKNFFNKPIQSEFNNFPGRQNKNQQLNEFKPSSPLYNFEQQPPFEEPFRPYTSNTPLHSHSPSVSITKDNIRGLPPVRNKIPSTREQLPDNFSYFQLAGNNNQNPFIESHKIAGGQSEKVTPKNHFSSFSTVGGFFNNNNPSHQENHPTVIPPSKVPKIISHFSITPVQVGSTESNYFSYNVLQNQKMKNYYATTTTTPNPTTIKSFPFIGNSNYYSNAPIEETLPPRIQQSSGIRGYDNTTPRITGFYITPSTGKIPIKSKTVTATTTTTKIPLSTKIPKKVVNPVQGPVVGIDFDFEKFVSDIRESHIAQMDPKIMDMLDMFRKKAIFNRTRTSYTTRKPLDKNLITQTTPRVISSNSYYENYNNKGSNKRYPTTIKSPITTTTTKNVIPKPPKGYESFIKSIPQKISPVTEKNPKDSQDEEQYSSEEEEEDDDNDEYYYDDDDEDYDTRPPSEKPPYMPNSETMAPKPQQVTTTKTTTPTTATKMTTITTRPKYKNHHFSITSEIATTTRRPVFSSHYNVDDDKRKIPSFINFPADIFQSIAPMKHTTTTTTTTTTVNPYENFEISKLATTSTTPAATISTTTSSRKNIYTVRPNRGNQKWKINKTTDKPNSRKRPVQQQIEIDDKFSNRVETSSQAPANIFIQQRQKPVAEQSTRNYYNTSSNHQSYDPYDSYYSVYDDDVDLYRDVEYNQQQQRGKTQQQSTFRPEIITTPSPSQVPVRETYINKPQLQQIPKQQQQPQQQQQQPQQQQPQQQQQGHQQYNQPSLVYNTDYEDALIAQIENDEEYSQPQRNQPIRGDRIEINSITDQPIVISSTLRTSDQPKYTPTTYAPISQSPTIQQQQPQQQSSSQNKLLNSPTIPIPTRPMDQYNIVSTTQPTANPTQSKQIPTTRSTLSEDGFNNKTTKSIKITLSSSAGSKPYQTETTVNSQNLKSNLSSSSSSSAASSQVRNVEILKESHITNTTQQNTERNTKTMTNENSKSKIISLIAGFSAGSSRSIIPTASSVDDDRDDQKKRITSFIVSDIEPQSFQTPQKLSITSTSSSTTSTSRPVIVSPASHIPSDVLKAQKTFRFSLTSGIGGLGSSSSQSSPLKGRVEEIPQYIRSKGDSKREITIESTTYIPIRSWRLTRTSPSPFATQDTNFLLDESDSKEADSFFSFKRHRGNDYVSGSGSENTPVTERSIKNDKVQSFTTRALVFKDNLNKAFDTTSSSKYVSPYKSLETILQEKEQQQIKLSPGKTTSKPRYSTPTTPTIVVSSQKPFRSYFLITAPPKNISSSSTTLRYTMPPTTTSTTTARPITSTTMPTTTTTTTTTSTTTTTTTPRTTSTTSTTTTQAPIASTAPIISRLTNRRQLDQLEVSPRGRARYTNSFVNTLEDEQPTTYSPKYRFIPSSSTASSTDYPIRRKIIRTRPTTASVTSVPSTIKEAFSRFNYGQQEIISNPKVEFAALKSEPSELATEIREHYRDNIPSVSSEIDQEDAFAVIDSFKSINSDIFISSTKEDKLDEITDQPIRQFSKFIQSTQEIENNYARNRSTFETALPELDFETDTELRTFTEKDPAISEEEFGDATNVMDSTTSAILSTSTNFLSTNDISFISTIAPSSTTITSNTITTTTTPPTTTTNTTTTLRPTQRQTTKYPKSLLPPRASRVNNAIKTSIAASRSKAPTALSKCADNTPNTNCNEIPSRTNTNTRTRGGAHYTNNEREQPATATSNRGTHPPRSRPTLKPSGTIVSKASEYIDIYRNPPSRPEPLYPQPTPDKTAAKCRKDVCLLPDCYCGGKDIPGEPPVETVPQIVLLTFDDSVNDLNKQLYTDLFEKGRVNPNGCPISATFYVSHEWTDYSQVQNLYSDGHEIASHTVSHSFGEQFSQKKWTREVAGQREILSAYGGVKLSDVRGMRAPFLSIGGNKMFKMLYDSNFTYDSSMPVYENRPPSWPYTLDYKIFHDCMIPPCPTKSYPGVWEVPMVMWQDLNGGRCSMGDACSNPGESEGVMKMLMKNFERHYMTNRAPFGLFYHAAWFTQPHHKEGFIKFLDTINAMNDVWIVTNWQALQWVRDPTPISRINQFQPFQCDYSDRPKRCNNPKVCNLWHKSGVRYMRTCQPCPDIYPWTGKTGIRSSRVDNDIEE